MGDEELFESVLVEFEEALPEGRVLRLAPFLTRAPSGYEAEMCGQLLSSAIRRRAGGNDFLWIDDYLDDDARDLWRFRTEVCLALTDSLYHTDDADLARRLDVLEFEDYRGTSVAGFGGFGVVVKARHKRDAQNLAAVKLAHPKINGAAALLDTEQDILQRLRDRNISGVPSLLASGICKRLDSKFIITTWIPGQPLDLWLTPTESRRPRRLAERLQLGYQLVKIVRDMNAIGICHGDLSPGNILIEDKTDGLSVTLVDFGNSVSGFVRNRKLAANAPYTAPELLLGKASRASAATDMWSLGVILCELVSGQHPFGSLAEDMTLAEMGKHFSEGTVTASPDPALAKLWQALEYCLTVEPTGRTRSMTLDTLLQCIASTHEFPLAPGPGLPGAEASRPIPTSRRTRLRRNLMSSAGAILLLIVAAIAYHFHTAAPFGAGGIAATPPADHPSTRPADFINSIGMQFQFIPAGKFLMGSPASEVDETGVHPKEENQQEVEITRPFYMGTYNVSRGEFRKFVTEQSYETHQEAENRKPGAQANYTWLNPWLPQTDADPVVYVDWYDAVAFTTWLSRKENKRYRLPLDAEWEYACRAKKWGEPSMPFNAEHSLPPETGSSSLYPGAPPLYRFKPNDWGLCDMHQCVWQWCYDEFDPKASGPIGFPDEIVNAKPTVNRCLRGGSRMHPVEYARSANRYGDSPTTAASDRGFRVVMEP